MPALMICRLHMEQLFVPANSEPSAGLTQVMYSVAPSIWSRAALMIALASEWTDRHSSYRSPRGMFRWARIQKPMSSQFLRPRGAPL